MTDGTASGEQHTYGDEAAAIKVSNANESWSCLVGNRTGGQGKTLVTQLLAEALSDAGVQATLASVDTAHGDTRSKLGALYSGAIDLAVAADIGEAAAEGDSMAGLRHWDGFVDVLRRKNVVIDIGANVWPPIAQWAEVSKPSRFIRGRPLNVLVVVTAQDSSIRDGLVMLSQVEAAAEDLNVGRVGVVLNQHGGKFEESDANVKALRAYIAERNLPTIDLTRGHVKATDMGVSIARLRKMDGSEYHKVRSSESEVAAWRELDFAQAWIEKAIAAFRAAGFAPAA